nr:MAG TPA: hypothetical protein [Bacteriophage sp.]
MSNRCLECTAYMCVWNDEDNCECTKNYMTVNKHGKCDDYQEKDIDEKEVYNASIRSTNRNFDER